MAALEASNAVVTSCVNSRQGIAHKKEVDHKTIAKSSQSFDQILNGQEIQFSKHAEKRLQSRKLILTDSDRALLTNAMWTLERKGARDSLVLMGELALIVHVPSRTVVTALSKDQMKEQVFTNIDSTLLVEKTSNNDQELGFGPSQE